jgi:hypothetical protein
MVNVKRISYGIETTSPYEARVSFNHDVLRWLRDFEKDTKINKIMFGYMQIKKQDELHVFMRKYMLNSFESKWLDSVW